MNRETRRIAFVAACIAAVVAVVGGVALNRLRVDSDAPDGVFILDEPGVYQEPVDGENPDLAGRGLPVVQLLDVNDQPVSLSDFTDGPLVVNLWYSTCAPCARELVDFALVDRELGAEGGDRVQFVGVNPRDSVPVMTRFAEERGVEYPLLRDASNLFGVSLDIVTYPVTLFVDADGVIVHQTGEIDAAQLRTLIDELF